MAETFGKAKLELTVDLEKFQSELKQALSMSTTAINDMKSGLSIDSGKMDLSGLKSSLESIDSTAKSTSDTIHTLGEKGTDSIGKLMKFQLVQGTLEGVKQAFMSVKDSVMDSTKEYATSELAVGKLQGGLDRLGSGDYFSRLLQQADDLHKITPFDDDDITNMQAMLTTFGATGDQIEVLTPKMLDLASAFAQGGDTGMDLSQTAILIGKATGADMVGAMQRVGVIMSDTQKKMFEAASGMDRINILSEILTQNTNITAEAFGKTLAGQLKISENAFKDIKETIGKAFAPVVKEVLVIIQQVADLFQQLPPELQAGAGALIIVTAAATALIPVLVALDVELAGIPLIIGAVVAGVGILYEVLTNLDAVKEFITELVGGQDVITKFKKTVVELYGELKELWDIVSDELSYAFSEIRTEVIDVWKSFTDLFGGSENLLNIIKTLGKDGLVYLKDILLLTIDSIVRVVKSISDTVQANSKWLFSSSTTGDGLKDFRTILEGIVKSIEVLITAIGRAAQAIAGLYNALSPLVTLSISDILNPEPMLAKIKLGMTQLKDAFSQTVKKGMEGMTFYGPQLDHPISQYEETKTPPTGNKKVKKESGSDKEKDPYKEENESLKNLMSDYDHLLKLKDNEVSKGEATLADRNEIVSTYIQEMQAIYDGLQNKENRSKVEEKISELTTKQFEDIKKAGEEQKKLVDDVDKFISKRTEKALQGAFKETAEIEIAYGQMYDKIDKTSVEASEKEFLRKQLDIKKEEELKLSAKKFDNQLNDELKLAMMKNSGDIYNLEVLNINSKYNKEKERITNTYKDSEERSKLLQANEIARLKELEKTHTEGDQRILDFTKSGFESVMSSINSGFKSMWENVFGEANSLFEVFAQNVFAQLEQWAASSFFKMLLNMGSGGILGSILGAFGFASGTSYTGDGRIDEIAGIVHKREAVMNAMGTQYPFNRVLVDIANRGIDLSKFIPSMDNINLPNISLPDLSFVSAQSQKLSPIVNIEGITVPVNALKLSDKDWIDLVDNDIIPQIARGLKRMGQATFTNQINN